jgi:nucleotide-binding universal stress UspA family protein
VKILVAVDDSPHSDRAVEFVTRMRWPGGSRLIVTCVMQPGMSLLPVTTTDAKHRTVDPRAKQRRHHEAVVTRSLNRLRAAGFSTEGLVVEGDPREQLIQLVERERIDLLVMGSRGRSGLARLMIGSVSAHAVSHAPCSVLVVKPTRRG